MDKKLTALQMKPKQFTRVARCRLVFGSTSLLIALSAHGLGVRIPNQDAAAIARGNAFVATADNPAAIYYNPAGIGQLEGHNIQAGSLLYLGLDFDYISPDGQNVHNEKEILPVPDLHYVYAPTDLPISFGVGAYSPFGLGLEWPEDAPFAAAGVKARMTYLTLNPVACLRLTKTLYLAAGPTFNYSEAELVQAQPAPGFLFRFKGTEWAYGFSAGALWQPHPKWSFGTKYFSATELTYGGTASFSPQQPFLPAPTPTKTHLDFPQIVVAGVSYRPSPNWNVEFDVDWSDWDTVNAARIEKFGGLPLHWQSSFFYHFGVTRKLGRGFSASAGYFFSEASTPEREYTPLVPDTDLHVASVGLVYSTSQVTYALAGQLIGGDYRVINDAANAVVNGRYKIFTPTLSFSIGYRF